MSAVYICIAKLATFDSESGGFGGCMEKNLVYFATFLGSATKLCVKLGYFLFQANKLIYEWTVGWLVGRSVTSRLVLYLF